MKYSCVIVDDNLLERDDLEHQLGKLGQLDIIGVCSDGLEASELLTHHPADILFTDIDMPQLSGLGLIKSLRKRPVIICISAHPQYAAQGFDLDVVDFVTKPASFERLMQAVNKAVDYLRLRSIDQPESQPGEGDNGDYFFIRETAALVRLQYKDVLYIESKADFSKVFTVQGKSHMTLVSLKNLEHSLPLQSFLRVHKQYIINRHHITAISNEDVTLYNDVHIPVSISHRQELLEKVVDNKLISRK